MVDWFSRKPYGISTDFLVVAYVHFCRGKGITNVSLFCNLFCNLNYVCNVSLRYNRYVKVIDMGGSVTA